jgi:lipopolysaccharide/colanic/teichoic acid biosynthesis glycosyltransferase
MADRSDEKGPKITASGDARITRVGRILRKAKLDEVPQLFNVVRGEMSLVGPRPEVPKYAEQYTPQEKKVLEVRPGITGPASLAYIDEERLLAAAADPEKFYVSTVMRQKLEFDLAYCRNVNLFEDLRIIFLTIAGVLGLRSAVSPKAVASNE